VLRLALRVVGGMAAAGRWHAGGRGGQEASGQRLIRGREIEL